MSVYSLTRSLAGRLASKFGPQQDGTEQNVLTDPYGRVLASILTASDHAAADDGSYYIGSMGVLGSGVVVPVGPASAVPADTTPFLVFTNPPNNPKNVWLKRVWIRNTSTQTSETGLFIQGQLDQLGSAALTTAATNLTVKNAYGVASVVNINTGTITKAAKTQFVQFGGAAVIRTTIPIANDIYVLKYGNSDPASYALGGEATVAIRGSYEMPAIVIPPGWMYSLHAAFGATSTGTPTFEVETAHIER